MARGYSGVSRYHSTRTPSERRNWRGPWEDCRCLQCCYSWGNTSEIFRATQKYPWNNWQLHTVRWLIVQVLSKNSFPSAGSSWKNLDQISGCFHLRPIGLLQGLARACNWSCQFHCFCSSEQIHKRTHWWSHAHTHTYKRIYIYVYIYISIYSIHIQIVQRVE